MLCARKKVKVVVGIQIEVSFIDMVNEEETLVLIECKNNSKVKIEKKDIAAFKAIIDDIKRGNITSNKVAGILAYAFKVRSDAEHLPTTMILSLRKQG